MFEIPQSPHRRRNPLTGEWVLVSPHRTDRPWQGQVANSASPAKDRYDPECYLCPGNLRAGGRRNPDYTDTFVFDNDYPALLPAAGSAPERFGNELLSAESVRGVCRVVCYSPRHDQTLADLSTGEIETVIATWANETASLTELGWIRHVQIFENRGAMMGASNPHPHGQIWAEDSVPVEAVTEARHQTDYWRTNGSCLLCDYRAFEEDDTTRLVFRNEHVLVVVPYWAVWPFELLVFPRRHVADLPSLDGDARAGLAIALKSVLGAYDRVFDTPFPYSMGFHQGPCGGDTRSHHLHAHFYPPLLRSATVQKFMVGYEMLAQPQRDITAEAAAERLASLVSPGP